MEPSIPTHLLLHPAQSGCIVMLLWRSLEGLRWSIKSSSGRGCFKVHVLIEPELLDLWRW